MSWLRRMTPTSAPFLSGASASESSVSESAVERMTGKPLCVVLHSASSMKATSSTSLKHLAEVGGGMVGFRI